MSFDVSVIIPAINEQARIGAAIRSAWAAGATEVVLADGGSQDDTLRIAKNLDCRVVESNAGRGTQLNAGASVAASEVLLFQHADCRLDADCLRQIIEARDARSRFVFGAFQQRLDATGLWFRLWEQGNAARVRFLGLAYGDQGLFVTRDAFEQVRGFPDFPIMEDVELARRLRRLGPARLLPGPLQVSIRRWQTHGLVRQTARNWCLLTAFLCGVPPASLQRFYPRHDQTRRPAS